MHFLHSLSTSLGGIWTTVPHDFTLKSTLNTKVNAIRIDHNYLLKWLCNFENNGKNSKIAPIICIESIYPRFVSNFASLGADIFVVITNDAWYDGTPGPRQHYLIAAARAIENKRFLVRCGNSGISGVISPLGNSLIELEPQTKAALSYKVPSNNKITIYTAQKDWLPITNILLIIITFIFFKYKNNI